MLIIKHILNRKHKVLFFIKKNSLTKCPEEKIIIDSDEEYQYEEVPVDEDFLTGGKLAQTHTCF